MRALSSKDESPDLPLFLSSQHGAAGSCQGDAELCQGDVASYWEDAGDPFRKMWESC